MKKILLLASLMIASVTYAQKTVPFVSAGTSISYTGDYSVGVEVGKWGIESPLSYALTVYAAPDYGDYWLGIKPYYTVLDKGKWSAMAYAYPQVALNRKMLLLEEGIGLNYAASNKLLIGYYFGMQHSKEYTTSPMVSLNLVYLFKKQANE